MNPEQFRIFYNQTIHPELMRLDRKRRGMLLRMGISFVLMLGVVALVFSIGIFGPQAWMGKGRTVNFKRTVLHQAVGQRNFFRRPYFR